MHDKHIPSQATTHDIALLRSWTDYIFAAPETLPISFRYQEYPLRGITRLWNPSMHNRRVEPGLVETITEGRDPYTDLVMRVEFTRYKHHPVIEWVAWIENQGTKPSRLIDDLLALDMTIPGLSPVIYHCNGDFYSIDGYTPEQTTLALDQTLTFAPTGGRPCDGAFPYFRAQFDDSGLALAVGWPGQWSASFTRTEKGLLIKAGQEKTHLRLEPGERIRTPRMAMMGWEGGPERAANLWRRWYREFILPRPDGQPLRPRLACAATEGGEEFTNASEENQLRLMDKFKQVGFDFDVWWIDAGWYPCQDEEGERRWWRTGTWQPDPERFPNGFAPIAQRAKELGSDLLVWFEPERVHAGTSIDRDHPEWLLRRSEKPDESAEPLRLLDLGNPAVRQAMTEAVCALIAENGISIYRQDFNFPPLAYWRDNDSEERQGMRENLHVQGYLQFWDDLLARNPGLWIDSCSSGGRRNDLETMRRSVPLHYTDYGYGDHAVKLAFHHTLFEWIPYFKECTLSWDVIPQDEGRRFDWRIDSFSFHCGMAAMLFATIDITRDDYDFAVGRQMIAIWRRAAPLLLHGDYYPHTPFSKSEQAWVAWQFDLPEQDEGFVQAIRLQHCPAESLTIVLQTLDPDLSYRFENPETGETFEREGKDLLETGITVSLPRRSGAIWFYHKV